MGVWVFGMVEITPERHTHIVLVDSNTATTLTSNLATIFNNETTILSNFWELYKDIIKNFAEHFTLNHNKVFFKDGIYKNTIEKISVVLN